jgi:hypothetical protein
LLMLQRLIESARGDQRIECRVSVTACEFRRRTTRGMLAALH